MPFMLTCWTGLIGLMKSDLKGVMEILAPVSIIRGTMSGDMGVMVTSKVAWKACSCINFALA